MSNYTSSNVVNNNNSRMRRVSSYSHSRPIVQNHRTLMETQKEKSEITNFGNP